MGDHLAEASRRPPPEHHGLSLQPPTCVPGTLQKLCLEKHRLGSGKGKAVFYLEMERAGGGVGGCHRPFSKEATSTPSPPLMLS